VGTADARSCQFEYDRSHVHCSKHRNGYSKTRTIVVYGECVIDDRAHRSARAAYPLHLYIINAPVASTACTPATPLRSAAACCRRMQWLMWQAAQKQHSVDCCALSGPVNET
jgi:hypothetical protein